jgi:cbb3-type cytochrome oxidase subunit 3
MKLLIAIAVLALWLFFPVKWVKSFWRRRRAIREAEKYSKTLLR